MNTVRMRAIEVLRKYQDHMTSSDYQDIMDGLTEIELLRDRDEELEDLWDQFLEILFDPESGEIQKPFLGRGKGINRAEILDWFQKRHSKGVRYLFGIVCEECGSCTCAYNTEGDGLRIFINDGVIDSIQITNETDLERLKQMLKLEVINFDSDYGNRKDYYKKLYDRGYKDVEFGTILKMEC